MAGLISGAERPNVLVGISLLCEGKYYTHVDQQVDALCALPSVKVATNCHSVEKKTFENKPCLILQENILGHKGVFWKRTFTQEIMRGFDFLWLIDSDLNLQTFNLRRFLSNVQRVNLSIVQPTVIASKASKRPKGSTVKGLNFGRKDNCEIRRVGFVEMMMPIISANYWGFVRDEILGAVPDKHLARNMWCIDKVWCHTCDRGCGLSNELMEHLNFNTIDLLGASNRSVVKVGRGFGMTCYILNRKFPSLNLGSRDPIPAPTENNRCLLQST